MTDFPYDEIVMLELARKHGLSIEVHESPIGGKPAYNLTNDEKSVCSGHFYRVLEFFLNLEKK